MLSQGFGFFLAPFQDFMFMRHALVACMALALGCGPVGVLLVLRRMSLVGDALSHAVLPGAALGFLIYGLSLYAMTLGGIIAGLAVALLAGAVTRLTTLREDASFAALYLISLALAAVVIAMFSGYAGLLLSFHGNLPSGPAIVLTAGLCYLFSVAFGSQGSIYSRYRVGEHLEG